MAELIIHTDRIKNNIRSLGDYLKKQQISWSLVTKVFSGDIEFLHHILTEEVIQHVSTIGDSRLTSLKNLRKVNPRMQTIYIKPPALTYVDEIVRYADISLNTSFRTIEALNEAARAQDKTHQVIIMIELGELREGVNREDILNFYKKVFNLSHIEVVGLGSNLGCMYGVEPTYDKLLQLTLYKDLINAKFRKNLKYISGGSSITLPLIEKNMIPPGVNHFRIGEAVFFGTSPLNNEQFMDLSTETFEFHAYIIELEEKGVVPDGIINEANIGHTSDYDEEKTDQLTNKAILDIGMLDVDIGDIECKDKAIKFVGTTSDMTVVDLGENTTRGGAQKYHVGGKVKFKANYMAIARLLNSKFIDKRFE